MLLNKFLLIFNKIFKYTIYIEIFLQLACLLTNPVIQFQ